MPSHEEHCQDSLERYGKRFDDLHHWLDEPSTLLGKGHRVHRHDLVETPKQAKELFGEFADQACLDHIRLDRLEERRLKRERSKKQNHERKDASKKAKFHKVSMKEIVTEYGGNELLEEIIQKCNETRFTTDQDYRIKRDKALIALLFLTGGLIREVLMLKKKNFVFENEIAKKTMLSSLKI
jgi:integrase